MGREANGSLGSGGFSNEFPDLKFCNTLGPEPDSRRHGNPFRSSRQRVRTWRRQPGGNPVWGLVAMGRGAVRDQVRIRGLPWETRDAVQVQYLKESDMEGLPTQLVHKPQRPT